MYKKQVLKGVSQEVGLHQTPQITEQWCEDDSSFDYGEERDEATYLSHKVTDL